MCVYISWLKEEDISFHLGNVLLALLEKNMVKHNTFEINSGRCQHCKTISRTSVTYLIDNITSINSSFQGKFVYI